MLNAVLAQIDAIEQMMLKAQDPVQVHRVSSALSLAAGNLRQVAHTLEQREPASVVVTPQARSLMDGLDMVLANNTGNELGGAA